MGAFIDAFAYIFICAFADAYFVFLRAAFVSNIVTHNSVTQKQNLTGNKKTGQRILSAGIINTFHMADLKFPNAFIYHSTATSIRVESPAANEPVSATIAVPRLVSTILPSGCTL